MKPLCALTCNSLEWLTRMRTGPDCTTQAGTLALYTARRGREGNELDLSRYIYIYLHMYSDYSAGPCAMELEANRPRSTLVQPRPNSREMKSDDVEELSGMYLRPVACFGS